MIKNCKSELQKMTQDLQNGMTFAMSIWSSGSLEWLQHDRCTGFESCGEPNLTLKNFVFTTAAYDGTQNEEEEENE